MLLACLVSAECIHSARDDVRVPMQGREVWEALGDWVTEAKPDLGPGTKQRFQMASQLQPDEVRILSGLVLQQTVLLVPSGNILHCTSSVDVSCCGMSDTSSLIPSAVTSIIWNCCA